MPFGGRSRDERGLMCYRCPSCHREITFPWVETMSQIDGETFCLSHKCPCLPEHIWEYTCQVDHAAIRRLLGGLRPVLPYAAAPAKPLSLRIEMERALMVFAWELALLSSVEEFLLWCSRPHQRG